MVREATARALAAQIGARSVSSDVRELLEHARDRDPEPRVREQAAQALVSRP
jgi:hypothetical protein